MCVSDSESQWQRVCAGDEKAFAAIYSDRADAIFRFCLRRVGDWAAAQDCVSMVFLEAWRLRARLRQEDSLNAWLFGIANNVVRNMVRARRRHAEFLDRLPTEQAVPSADDAAAARLDAEQAVRPFIAALNKLRRADRELIALAAWGDLTTVELGVALGIPAGTVKSRLARARKRLMTAVASDATDDAVRPLTATVGVKS